MNKTREDVLIFGIAGLIIGSVPAIAAAGACALWLSGISLSYLELDTILRFMPTRTGSAEPFKTAALTGAGVWALFALGAIAIGFRPTLTSHGSAKWATQNELSKAGLVAPLKKIEGPIFAKFGTARQKRPFLTSTEIPHSLIAAPTGSGKGVGIVIPTLLTYNGSVVCLDVKGENFELTSRRRKALGDKIFKFAPYDKEGRTHRYNPVDIVAAAEDRRRFTEARRLAANLIIAKSKSAEGFLEGAREIFAATTVFAIEQGMPSIAAIYDLISQHGEAHKNFEAMADRAKAPESVSIFNRMASTDIRTLSAYLSVLADGGLSLWADPAVRDATSTSDFSFTDLRRKPASIYFVVGPNDLDPLSSLIRLMFQQAVSITQREMPKADEPFPVLFLLDEFASLGRMDALSQAITTLRGYGGRLMIIVQSLSNLQVYGQDGAQNFLANCRLQLFMAPADKDTPDYISRAIGDFTRKSRSKSWQSDNFLSTNIQERAEGARLIRPEELRKLGEDTIVALIQNQDPVKTHKVTYYKDKELRGLFEGQRGPLPEPPSIFEDETEEARRIVPTPRLVPAPPKDEERGPAEDEAAEDAADHAEAVAAPQEPIAEDAGNTSQSEAASTAPNNALSAIARAKMASAAMEQEGSLPADLEKAVLDDLDDHFVTHLSPRRAISEARRKAEAGPTE